MTASRRLAPLPLLLIGLAALCAVLLFIPWAVQAESQEVTPTAGAAGDNPPAQPTNLQASAEHDEVALTWTASTDQTVTHYAILRRNPDTDASQVFHVIESNSGADTSYTDSWVSASSKYIYPGEGGQPHRRQPVVRLRQSRHPDRTGPHAYTHGHTHGNTGADAGIHASS